MSLDAITAAIAALGTLPTAERIAAINQIAAALHAIHPNQDPVSAVRWVPADQVIANDYNPNSVMPPEMRLLYLSIKEDGYTQPIVTIWDDARQKYVVVDGFHRNRVGKEYADIRARTHGYLPIVVLDKTLADRMTSTIRHNRARGKHAVLGMVHIVVELVNMGWSDEDIGTHLGMDADEVLRLKQTSGIPSLFAQRSYSRSWVLDPDRVAARDQ